LTLDGTGTAYASGAHEFTPGVWWSSFFSIFGFLCNVLWIIVLLLAIVLSVLRFTSVDYVFGIFKLFLIVRTVLPYLRIIFISGTTTATTPTTPVFTVGITVFNNLTSNFDSTWSVSIHDGETLFDTLTTLQDTDTTFR